MSATTPAQSLQSSTPLASPAVYRFTVDEFERIADSLDNDQVELIDGYIVGRGAMKPSHVLASELLKGHIQPLLPRGRFLREDKPIRIPDFDEPRPDLAVVRGDPMLYAYRHPGPGDVSLLVEVSDSTLARDRGEKWINYARSGIPVYWIVNLVDHQVEVFTDPTAAGYGSRVVYARSLAAQFVPVVIDGIEVGQIAVSEILSPEISTSPSG
jgi:Uma2 family endonuclease